VIEAVFEYPVREHLGIIVARESLVLEGLEIRASFTSPDRTSPSDVLRAFGSLSIANCRLVLKTNSDLATADSNEKTNLIHSTGDLTLRNSQFIGCGRTVAGYGFLNGKKATIENCIFDGFAVFSIPALAHPIEFSRNTMVAGWRSPLGFIFNIADEADKSPARPIAMNNNLILSRHGATEFFGNTDTQIQRPQLRVYLPSSLFFAGKDNCYSSEKGVLYFGLGTPDSSNDSKWKTWMDYSKRTEQLWTKGILKLTGGALLARLDSEPENLQPDDHRLRPDSAGYRAGPDGKDLGADVDLVGPGDAYERWKKTPEYQEWRVESKQQE
jgi:hypothetical protein